MDSPIRIPRPREDLKSFSAYGSGTPPASAVRLGQNEWPGRNAASRYTTPDELDALVLNRYAGAPDELRSILAERYGVSPEQLAFGNGSNDTLLDLFLIFGGRDRVTLLFQPTYAMYGRLSVLAGGTVANDMVGLPYTLTEERVLTAMQRTGPAVVVFCTPNNPTGTLVDDDVILAVAERYPETLVIVDEAYSDISGTTVLPAVAEHPNLIVSKTFSKVFAAAGLRLGVLVLHPILASSLRAIRFPFNVSVVTNALAVRIAQDHETVRQRIEQIRDERDRIFRELERVESIETYPSAANFILFRVQGDAAEVQKRFLEHDIIIRDTSSWSGCERCLRVSVGTAEEKDRFLEAARAILTAHRV